MSIFYVDENLSSDLARSLSGIFLQHRFLTPKQCGLLGVDDIPLFGELAARDVECLITLDKMQLENSDERDGLRSAGLHWLGASSDVDGRGVRRIAAHLGMVAPGVGYVLDYWLPHPAAYRCRPPGGQPVLDPEVI